MFILFHSISEVQKLGISAITLKKEQSAKKQNFSFWFADSVFVCQNKCWGGKEIRKWWENKESCLKV